MKKRVQYIAIMFLVSIFFFAGCKKDSTPTDPGNGGGGTGSGSITLNGGSFSNKQIVFSLSAAGYSLSEQLTVVVCFGTNAADSAVVDVSFPGNATGNYNWNLTQGGSGTSGVLITMGSNYTNFWYSANGTTNVTKVEAPGGKVEGTFSGWLRSAVNPLDSIQVSGSFSAKRIVDSN